MTDDKWTTVFDGTAVDALDAGVLRFGNVDNFEAGQTLVLSEPSDYEFVEAPQPDIIITSADSRTGVITVERILRDGWDYVFREGDFAVIGLDRTTPPVRLAGAFGSPVPESTIPPAAIAVVTTIAAFEWLRRRKAEVAAAERNEEAYRGLLAEFVTWLRWFLGRMRGEA